MANEDEKILWSPEILFPEAAKRVKILENLKNSWVSVLRNEALARHSFPYNLGVNEISIAVDNDKAADMLSKMKGNILRILKKFEYQPKKKEEFVLTITRGVPEKNKLPEKNLPVKKNSAEIKIEESELKELMSGAPATLPEDINYAISHLKIFLDKKFPRRKS